MEFIESDLFMYFGEALIGLADANIGDTIADAESPEKLKGISIDEPTLSMVFSVNNSPFAGREGEYVTSRHLRDRLFKEIKTNVSMRLEETESPDAFIVSGRGELHLSVLIETMRREGYELQVGKPKVIMHHDETGTLQEPMEALTIDVPQEFMGAVMEGLGLRKAELTNMTEMAGYLRMEFVIPARGRTRGSLVAFENGETTSYGIGNAQERGNMFIIPGEQVYEGQIIGENSRDDDMDVNPCKKKHVSNMRASGSDDTIRLIPPKTFSLEQALEHINDDELVEVTPKNIRMRKKILDRVERGRQRSRNKA